jgi:hypothetical protein
MGCRSRWSWSYGIESVVTRLRFRILRLNADLHLRKEKEDVRKHSSAKQSPDSPNVNNLPLDGRMDSDSFFAQVSNKSAESCLMKLTYQTAWANHFDRQRVQCSKLLAVLKKNASVAKHVYGNLHCFSYPGELCRACWNYAVNLV